MDLRFKCSVCVLLLSAFELKYIFVDVCFTVNPLKFASDQLLFEYVVGFKITFRSVLILRSEVELENFV